MDSGLQEVKYNEDSKGVPLVGHFYGSKTESTEIYLGEARTDDQGRLVVLAGRGESKSIANKDEPYPYILTDFDSPDWIDDTSDGWISVHVTYNSNQSSYVFIIIINCVKTIVFNIIQLRRTGEGSSHWNDTKVC